MQQQLDHVTIIGGSVAGLVTAAGVSDHFDRVTIVERDELPEGAGHRQGVPQARQLHVLLPLGAKTIDEMLPGFESELHEAGCPVFDEVRDTPWFGGQGWRARSDSDVQLIGFARPVLEDVLRRRVLALDNVEVERGTVGGLLATDDGKRVTGVAVKKPAPREIEADLVVDASGRGTKAPKWLEGLGYERPAEQHVRAYFGYASRLVRVPEGAMPDGLEGLITMPFPGHHKGGLILPADNGRHTLCCIGAQKDYPPADEEGFYEYLRQAPSPLLAEIGEQCEPLTEIHTYHHPGNQRRMWVEMVSRPLGFLPIGDAVASFNPIYGQGMTVAALEASRLGERIVALEGDLDRLPGAFQEDLRACVEFAYTMATGADAAYPETEFVNADRPPPENTEFFAGVEQVATEDPEVARDILRATGWFDADLLAAPELIGKVERWLEAGSRVRHNDPTKVPEVVMSESKQAEVAR